MANRRQYKHRRKWTDQMNEDLLSCKREAVAMTQMEQPPLDGNSMKKDYIKLVKELWDAKGYNDLGFSSQNLRDQAARLEKSLELGDSRNVSRDSVAINQNNLLELNKDNLIRDSQTGEGSNGFDMSAKDAALIDELQYTNQTNELQTTTHHDLHNSRHEIPGALDQNEDNALISGCLPEYNNVNKPPMINCMGEARRWTNNSYIDFRHYRCI
ncbi:Hypothetical predicted protein [Paramuricea clavata]|uniref:Uncharacterized protein n=1 Tax=Paramuricea clavata TaxID=317549 RepID=A0A7D9ELM1_PARCT|nr:Hypothetical predicted protein [Paramuricea clavata]